MNITRDNKHKDIGSMLGQNPTIEENPNNPLLPESEQNEISRPIPRLFPPQDFQVNPYSKSVKIKLLQISALSQIAAFRFSVLSQIYNVLQIFSLVTRLQGTRIFFHRKHIPTTTTRILHQTYSIELLSFWWRVHAYI